MSRIIFFLFLPMYMLHAANVVKEVTNIMVGKTSSSMFSQHPIISARLMNCMLISVFAPIV